MCARGKNSPSFGITLTPTTFFIASSFFRVEKKEGKKTRGAGRIKGKVTAHTSYIDQAKACRSARKVKRWFAYLLRDFDLKYTFFSPKF